MSTLTRSTRHVIRGAAALIFVATAALAGTSLNASPADAAQNCKMWALTDRVDRQGRIYGAGGVDSCHFGVTKWIDVWLYRDGKLVSEAPAPHGAAGPDCRSLPCASSAPAVDINGSHTWCTHVIVHLLVPDPGADHNLGEQTQRQIDCAVT